MADSILIFYFSWKLLKNQVSCLLPEAEVLYHCPPVLTHGLDWTTIPSRRDEALTDLGFQWVFGKRSSWRCSYSASRPRTHLCPLLERKWVHFSSVKENLPEQNMDSGKQWWMAMDGNEWQLMAMDLKEWQPDAILVSPTGSICLRLTTFPGCEIRRPGRFMSRSFSGTGRNFWKALCCRPYQVMSSLP